jgi:FLYWCH zinc finger domain
MDLKTTVSVRGKQLLVLDSFKFRKFKELKSGEIFWRCTEKRCTAKVFTVGSENTVCRSDLNHSHLADEKKLNRQIVCNSAKRKAAEDIAERPSKIIHMAIKENVDQLNSLSVKDVTYIRNNIYHKRRQLQPELPQCRQEVFDVLDNLCIQTLKGEHFLLVNDRQTEIVIFACPTNLKILCSSVNIYMDGTFNYCTKFFTQLFTIHI